MPAEQLIPASEFCERHHIDITFIRSLNEYGLLEVTSIEETIFIHPDSLRQVEQFMRLHYDLEINLPGIDAISNLLHQLEDMHDEIRLLKNRLQVYEND
jgi:MerR HTH family regulatory protein